MAASARIHILTFKEGLLSRVAHDLRLHVEDFEAELSDDEPRRLRFEIPVSKLRVDGAMKSGRVVPGELSASDKRDIESNLAEVFGRRSAKIAFDGELRPESATSWTLAGGLEMAGRSRDVTMSLRRRGERFEGSTELKPSRWGIAPYKALAGAIRLKDLVRIEASVAAGLLTDES